MVCRDDSSPLIRVPRVCHYAHSAIICKEKETEYLYFFSFFWAKGLVRRDSTASYKAFQHVCACENLHFCFLELSRKARGRSYAKHHEYTQTLRRTPYAQYRPSPPTMIVPRPTLSWKLSDIQRRGPAPQPTQESTPHRQHRIRPLLRLR